MADYALRHASVADLPVISDHRQKMFSEMGKPMDADCVASFERWLKGALATGLYQGWLAQTADGTAVAGAGLMVIPWPPGPRDSTPRAAFIYNVYTEPEHRQRGLARRLMNALHDWCREQEIRTLRLHASAAGRVLYESLGYSPTNEMMVML
jgi:GNAT superfamily N-acetyltransferase